MESKNNFIGFIWHKTPVISQYLLKKQHSDSISFEQWCKNSIEDFEKSYNQSIKQTQDDSKYLKNLGCSRIAIVPEPVGVIRCELFEKFLDEIPENTFIIVKSFAGFGLHRTLVYCLRLALSKKIYVITEQHKSLTFLPIDLVPEVYEDWVIKQNIKIKTRKSEINISTARNLIHNGLSIPQVIKKMGISRSTFYRLLSEE